MKLLLVILTLFPMVSISQDFEHVMIANDDMQSVNASISDISWLQGHWKGEALGGIVEELWSPPLGDSMMGSFKLLSNDGTDFYELQIISEENGTLIFRLKHFGSHLEGWEPKEKPESQALLKIDKTTAWFDGITFEKAGNDELNVYVVFDHEGQQTEAKFAYTKE